MKDFSAFYDVMKPLFILWFDLVAIWDFYSRSRKQDFSKHFSRFDAKGTA